MKTRINAIFTRHRLQTYNSVRLYFVDYTDKDRALGVIPNRGSVLLPTCPIDIKSVFLYNPATIFVCFDGFPEFAFPKAHLPGKCHNQCECVIFPDRCNNDDWVLFIETKYAKSAYSASKPEKMYLKKALFQIVRSVSIFREKGILDPNKQVDAIISFPVLTQQFNETFFLTKQRWVNLIQLKYKIRIRGINSATIVDERTIKLRSVCRSLP